MQVFITFFKKNTIFFADIKKSITFALAIEKQTIAQMAESVDALVSNTSGATHPGSIPGLGTKRKSRVAFPLLLYILLAKIRSPAKSRFSRKKMCIILFALSL